MRVSLLDGWFPDALRIATAIVVLLAAGWRNRRWRTRWLPTVAATAVTGAIAAWLAVPAALALVDPLPPETWIWLAVLLFAALMLIVGWRGGRWWRRGLAALAVPLTTVTLANAVNAEIGYYPTLRDAWLSISHAPMPASCRTFPTRHRFAGNAYRPRRRSHYSGYCQPLSASPGIRLPAAGVVSRASTAPACRRADRRCIRRTR